MGKTPSSLELAFETIWKWLDGPPYEAYHRFQPGRKRELDIAFPDVLVAVELEGGVWSRGRHVRPAGYEEDCRKYNAATAMGWRLFRVTTKMLQADPRLHLQPIIDFVRAEREAGREDGVAEGG